ncbi:MAG: hypothetical protein JWO06_740 [Bacteroidota bacterium]|nr:hypothetical protein [Bacteroidota bacterium]
MLTTNLEYYGDFFKRAIQLCSKVDEFGEQLGLDPLKILAFKSNKLLLDFSYNNKQHFDEFKKNSLNDGLNVLRGSFVDIMHSCKKSTAYTAEIGKELGIENFTIPSENIFHPDVIIEYCADGHPKLKWKPGDI